MIELITPHHAALWDGHTVQVLSAQEAIVNALHIAHIVDVKLARGLFGSGYNITVQGSLGHHLLIPVDNQQLTEAEAFIAEIAGAITRRKAGKG
jgi:hypothetical protein